MDLRTAGREARAAAGRLQRMPFLRGRAWNLLLGLNILASVVLGILLVWLSIERMDTTYFINLEQNSLRVKQSLHAKLEVEKGRLLSPYELRQKAEELRMKEPVPGQIRRLSIRNLKPRLKKDREEP